MSSILKMSELDLKNKKVLIREDLNVPMENGKVANDARIRAAIPTIKLALKQNAAVIILSHLGRPTEGKPEAEFSLAPIATCLSELLQTPVRFVENYLDGVSVSAGEVILCENVRFNAGETKDDEALSKKLANLADIFVMDAFAVAHRAHASTHGVARYAKIACAGPLLVSELEALSQVMQDPQHPLAAIIGGGKVSTKLPVLQALIERVDTLIVGGGIANTFMLASGIAIGKSLHEASLIEETKNIFKLAAEKNVSIPMPIDVVIAKEFNANAVAEIKSVENIAEDDLVLDIGPKTIEQYSKILLQSKTILWNGPVGVFEMPAFANGTKKIAEAIANSGAFTVAGGGDTVAAIEQFQLENKISYVSTGGGAFLEFVEGRALPGVVALQK